MDSFLSLDSWSWVWMNRPVVSGLENCSQQVAKVFRLFVRLDPDMTAPSFTLSLISFFFITHFLLPVSCRLHFLFSGTSSDGSVVIGHMALDPRAVSRFLVLNDVLLLLLLWGTDPAELIGTCFQIHKLNTNIFVYF